MFGFGFLLLILIVLLSFAFFIGTIVFIARDAGQHNQSPALWIILFIFLGGLGLPIYLFVTKRVGWGLFWLIGVPIILSILFFVGIAGMFAGI